jgi:hypothetical protein
VVVGWQDGGIDPFHHKPFRNFIGHYCSLWDKALQELYAAERLFDEYLLDKIISLVTALNT